jgi:hypothetical protein
VEYNGIDDVFTYNIALNIFAHNDDHKSNSIKDCRQGENWPKWKDAIDEELNLLYKQQVLDLLSSHDGVKPVGYKWVFMQKRMKWYLSF